MLEIVTTSSTLIVAVILLRRIFRASVGSRARYALWCLVLVRLLMPVSLVESPVSIMNAVNADSLAQIGGYQVPMLPIGTSQAADTSEYATDSTIVRAEPQTPPAAEVIWLDIRLSNALTLIWVAGMAAMAIWFLTVNGRFGAALKANCRIHPVAGSKLPVYVADGLASPCLFGLLRPRIYLTPEALESSVTTSYVLLHEQTHYLHGDHIWALLRVVCLTVYWFNPLVWIAAWLSRIDCEQACDEAVVRRIGSENRTAYGHTLLDMIIRQPSPTMLACTATTMTAGRREIQQRIILIARNRKTVKAALLIMVAAAVLLVGCTFSGAVSGGSEGTSADAALHTLFESVSLEDGTIRFTIPKNDFQPEDWHIILAGRLEIEDFGGMSTHIIDSEGESYHWQPGQEYFFELDGFDSIVELVMQATLQGEQTGSLVLTLEKGVLLSIFKQVGTSTWVTDYSLNEASRPNVDD